ncbi:MAG: CBS domain-containing protein [Chitinispirillaceae bacterium]
MDTTYSWKLGILGAAGVLLTVFLHEIGHTAAGRLTRTKRTLSSIYIFGAVENDFLSASHNTSTGKAVSVLAGPFTSLLTTLLWYLLMLATRDSALNEAVTVLLYHLACFSFLLGVINFIPATPLDTGYALRPFLNAKLTRIQDVFSDATGTLFILCGLTAALRGYLVYGIWLFIPGIYLFAAMRTADMRIRNRNFLRGEKTGYHMSRNPVTVPGRITLKRFLREYIHKYNLDVYPVCVPASPVRFIRVSALRTVSPENWDNRKVSELSTLCTDENSVTCETDIMDTLEMMRTTSCKIIIVTDQKGNLQGVVSYKDLLHFLSLKLHLNEHCPAP